MRTNKAKKICFDRILPTNLAKVQQIRKSRSGRSRAISLIGKQWPNGSTISIRFVDGSTQQQDLVRQHAVKWTKHANLKFEFTDDPTAVIRVTFDANDGAWSYVGTDNLSIPLHAATLNLGWQDKGVILHEFGHMIGLSHEHQNPVGGINWNEEAVIADLAGPPNFWSPETTRHNVLNKYRVDQIHGTDFDPKSIMLYAFPASWTTDGFSTSENEKLSVLDKAFVKASAMYPFADPVSKSTPLAIADTVTAEIGEPGEIDTYTFRVTDTGVYILQTLGTTDMYMTLFGPDSTTTKVAENDDAGAGRNAQIMAELEPGEYLLQVRHFSEESIGDYRVLVAK